MEIGRRIRGVLGLGAAWGVAFAALALAFLAGMGMVGAFPVFSLPRGEVFSIVTGALVGGAVAGLLAGVLFATILAGAEHRRTFAVLSATRVTTWGFIGGAAILPAFVAIVGPQHGLSPQVMAIGSLCYGLLSAAMARLTIGAARRAPQLAPDAGRVNGGDGRQVVEARSPRASPRHRSG